uniref:pentatricopeptide repeat-containing protein At2g03880, mitochondrial n=1 Tax=Erigeron canadensis TaxID=72917 RepID=UPI001CB8E989|nr:pentatricopeptide repeat-containing protein At2g03880, mitochondrial [Erigeron canadensis]XP_043626835.1 pentatricopeptide repeat-containing protein At2g03880, mitochondrial [Erigeron canadensis]XP_043626843.1 pentatricopeptide repeat-containing protein At2g03880, mitochondrial [Erigeron canadensis]
MKSISIYKHKSLAVTLQSFFQIHHKTHPTFSQSHSPNTVLDEFTASCYRKDLSSAIKALNFMQENHIWADSVTYSELVKCCLARGAIREAKLVQKHVFSNGYEPKTFLVNIFINMYVKFNMLDDARKLFDEMPERNVVSWTTMIAGFANAVLEDEAMRFLVLMVRDGVSPNTFTYSSVLKACSGLFSLRQIHCGISKAGLDSHVFVRSALIDNYSKWGELQNALVVFDEKDTRDLIVWNSVIGAFAQNSDGDEALSLFKRMKRCGLMADQATLTSVLRACTGLSLLELGRQVHVHVLKYDRDLILSNALLDMYCKCGSMEDARFEFSRMVDKDVISWSTMIIGLAQNGFSHDALETFQIMKRSGTKPNYITLLGVLFACSHAGLVDKGRLYFQSMEKFYGIKPGREHYGCMVDLLGRAGNLDEAVDLIHSMGSDPDVVTWRTLLGACKIHDNRDLAAYAAKRVLDLEPDDAGTYVLLSNVYAKTRRWEDADQVRKTMKRTNIKKEPGCSWIEVNKQIHAFMLRDNSHPEIDEIIRQLNHYAQRLKEAGYVPNTDCVLHDVEGEQMEDPLLHHSEKLAIVYGLMALTKGKTIRIKKNLRICEDCHQFAKLLANMENRYIVIRDPIRYHHFQGGVCSCGDYW